MIVSANRMSKQLDADRKLGKIMSHVRDAIEWWMPRVDECTKAEMERLRTRIEEIVNGRPS